MRAILSCSTNTRARIRSEHEHITVSSGLGKTGGMRHSHPLKVARCHHHTLCWCKGASERDTRGCVRALAINARVNYVIHTHIHRQLIAQRPSAACSLTLRLLLLCVSVCVTGTVTIWWVWGGDVATVAVRSCGGDDNSAQSTARRARTLSAYKLART